MAERHLYESEALEVVLAILEGASDPLTTERVAEVLAVVDVSWWSAHDRRVERDDAITKDKLRRLLADLKGKRVRIVSETHEGGRVELVYRDGQRVDLGASKIRRRQWAA